jgi:hypothetical protein
MMILKCFIVLLFNLQLNVFSVDVGQPLEDAQASSRRPDDGDRQLAAPKYVPDPNGLL